MARKVNTASRMPVTYVPDVDENRDLDKDPNPFWVKFIPLNGSEMRAIEQDIGRLTKMKKDPNFMKMSHEMAENLVSEKVIEVGNYIAHNRETGTDEVASNGADLVRLVNMAGPEEWDKVIDNIFGAMRDSGKLEEGLLDRLRSQSKRSAQETSKSGPGVASSADGPTRLHPVGTPKQTGEGSGTATG